MKTNTRMLILAALFAALTAIGAFLRIPLGALSMSLQTFFTILAGVLLGARWGALSQAVYVVIGLVGLPVFTMGGGPGYLFQPSFGFLLGLIPGALVTGLVARGRGDRPAWAVLACAAGTAVIYAVGLPYMYLIFNAYLGQTMTVRAAVTAGMLVYLPGDAVKIVVTALLARPLVRALARSAG